MATKKVFCLGLLLGLAAPLAGHASVTDYVTNNSFEDVAIGSPYRSTNPADVPGWTQFGQDGDALIWRIGYSDGSGNIATAGHGSQFVTLGCGFSSSSCGLTSWSQTVSLPAGAYTLAFDIAAEFGPGSFGGAIHTQSLTVGLSGGASASQAFSADGSVAGNYWRDWETKSLLFSADGSPVTLTFSTVNLPYDIGIDDVHILSAIPEPQSYALLLAGLGLLSFAARRRRQGSI